MMRIVYLQASQEFQHAIQLLMQGRARRCHLPSTRRRLQSGPSPTSWMASARKASRRQAQTLDEDRTHSRQLSCSSPGCDTPMAGTDSDTALVARDRAASSVHDSTVDSFRRALRSHQAPAICPMRAIGGKAGVGERAAGARVACRRGSSHLFCLGARAAHCWGRCRRLVVRGSEADRCIWSIA